MALEGDIPVSRSMCPCSHGPLTLPQILKVLVHSPEQMSSGHAGETFICNSRNLVVRRKREGFLDLLGSGSWGEAVPSRPLSFGWGDSSNEQFSDCMNLGPISQS